MPLCSGADVQITPSSSPFSPVLRLTSMKASNVSHMKHKGREKAWRRPLPPCLLFILALIAASSVLLAKQLEWFTQQGERTRAGILWDFGIHDKHLTSYGPSTAPVLAYAIGGSMGDAKRMLRLLKALYHPRNEYLLHLDDKSPPDEVKYLTQAVAEEKVYAQVKNVHIVAKPNRISYRGATMLTWTLHAMAILLRYRDDWDWYINLSASDYPLLPQDDMLQALSSVPKDLNFVQYDGRVGQNEVKRATMVFFDQALHSANDSTIVNTNVTRPFPTAFRIFSGSAWMILSRGFCDFCIQGYDNLPRSLLVYYANYASSPEGYFQTTICNSPEFRNTTVNDPLRFINWDDPPKQHPRDVRMGDWEDLTKKGYLFARKFPADSPMLDHIDAEMLHRKPGFFTPGAWCAGDTRNKEEDPCNVVTKLALTKPTVGTQLVVKRLMKGIAEKAAQQLYHKCQ